jgi:hypothetical protein
MAMKLSVKIRYNTNYPEKHDKKWRVLVDENHHFVDEVVINCKSFTTEDIVKSDTGEDVLKYHLSCNPKNVSFVTRKGKLKAVIK